MNRLNPRTLSLVGFAASEWAGERINGSRHRRLVRNGIAAVIGCRPTPDHEKKSQPESRTAHFPNHGLCLIIRG